MQKRGKYRWWECRLWENADFGNADGRGFNLCVAPSLRNLVSVISELQKDFRNEDEIGGKRVEDNYLRKVLCSITNWSPAMRQGVCCHIVSHSHKYHIKHKKKFLVTLSMSYISHLRRVTSQ